MLKLGQKGKLFLMFKYVTLRTLMNFGHQEDIGFEFHSLGNLKIQEHSNLGFGPHVSRPKCLLTAPASYRARGHVTQHWSPLVGRGEHHLSRPSVTSSCRVALILARRPQRRILLAFQPTIDRHHLSPLLPTKPVGRTTDSSSMIPIDPEPKPTANDPG
jgi:hypothetical protein